jgi:hypothetical protein
MTKTPKIKSEEEKIREDWKNWLSQSEDNTETYRLPTEKDIADYWLAIIKEREESIIKLIKENTRFVCGACQGAKCEHTQGCQFREEIINQIKQTK